MAGLGMEPLAQFVGGSQLSQPLVDLSLRLAQAAGPKAVNQHACSVCARHRLIDSLDRDRHGLNL